MRAFFLALGTAGHLPRLWIGDPASFRAFQSWHQSALLDRSAEHRLFAAMIAVAPFDDIPSVGGYITQVAGESALPFRFQSDHVGTGPWETEGAIVEPKGQQTLRNAGAARRRPIPAQTHRRWCSRLRLHVRCHGVLHPGGRHGVTVDSRRTMGAAHQAQRCRNHVRAREESGAGPRPAAGTGEADPACVTGRSGNTAESGTHRTAAVFRTVMPVAHPAGARTSVPATTGVSPS